MNPWELLIIGLGWIVLAILALLVLVVVVGIVVAAVKSAKDAARRKRWSDRELEVLFRDLDEKGER